MKKYSKKWRKLQKEKEIRRATTKVGDPFSKAKKQETLMSALRRSSWWHCSGGLLFKADTHQRYSVYVL